MTQDSETMNRPVIRRVRHELKFRELTVTEVSHLTPHMIRVTVAGDDLDGFLSASPDDHVKVFFPREGGEPERRDYTPRRHDAEANSLVLDFVDHEGGPAADWARGAKVGDPLSIGGPRGSQVIEGDIAHWLLIGDETALPAIGRYIEEMGAGTKVTSLVAVPGPADEQGFDTAAELDSNWIHRPLDAATDPAPYIEALKAIELGEKTFVWIAAEAAVARALRAYMTDQRSVPLGWLKASGYWIKGEADASEKNIE